MNVKHKRGARHLCSLLSAGAALNFIGCLSVANASIPEKPTRALDTADILRDIRKEVSAFNLGEGDVRQNFEDADGNVIAQWFNQWGNWNNWNNFSNWSKPWGNFTNWMNF